VEKSGVHHLERKVGEEVNLEYVLLPLFELAGNGKKIIEARENLDASWCSFRGI